MHTHSLTHSISLSLSLSLSHTHTHTHTHTYTKSENELEAAKVVHAVLPLPDAALIAPCADQTSVKRNLL
jgi:hypothetical protein